MAEEDLVRDYQAREASNKRFREASEKEKSIAAREANLGQFLRAIDQRPLEFAAELRKLGVKPEKFAEAVLQPLLEEEIRRIEDAQMTPEQRKVAGEQRELEQYRKADAQRKVEAEETAKTQEQQKHEAEVETYRNQYAGMVQEAMKATPFAQTHALAYEMSNLLAAMVESGIPVDAQTLAAEFESMRQQQFTAVQRARKDTKMIDPELLEAALKERTQKELAANPMATSKPLVGVKRSGEGKEKPKLTYGSAVRELQMGRGIVLK